jgi:hypothetical protein
MEGLMRTLFAAAALALALPGVALAQATTTTTAASPMASITRFGGEVTALSATSISVRGDDGQTTTLPLAPDYMLVIGHVIQASDIKPGDFVATANINVDDTSGRSVELRVFPPGVHMGEGSYSMAAPNTTMTNATVAEVTDAADGRVLTVRYPGGERHITLPSTVTVVGQTLADHAQLHVGAHVRGFARANAQGVLTTGYLYTGENGAPPPGR